MMKMFVLYAIPVLLGVLVTVLYKETRRDPAVKNWWYQCSPLLITVSVTATTIVVLWHSLYPSPAYEVTAQAETEVFIESICDLPGNEPVFMSYGMFNNTVVIGDVDVNQIKEPEGHYMTKEEACEFERRQRDLNGVVF